jgi:hypothetical protein
MKLERDNRLDALKAISITFVLIWHLHPISFLIDSKTHTIIWVVAKIVKDLELQLTLTAVPLFYLVSLYLFFIKNENLKYLQSRLIKLLKIFAFWWIFNNIFLLMVTKQLPNFSWEVMIGLKPSLPLVGDSVFYFLFNLIALTTIAFLYTVIPNRWLKIISSIIIIFSIIYFEAICIVNSDIPYHWLSNFIIYIPLAYYLANSPNKILKFKFLYLVAYILFSLHDIYLRTFGYSPSIYGRVSIVCGALTIFCFIYSSQIPENWYVQKLAKYSLGLFALHKYWQCLILLLINHYGVGIFTGLLGIPLNLILLLVGFLVVLLTIATIYLFKLTTFKQFIT